MIINSIGGGGSRRLLDLPTFDRDLRAENKDPSRRGRRIERLALSFDGMSPAKQLQAEGSASKRSHASQTSLTKFLSHAQNTEKRPSAKTGKPRPHRDEPGKQKPILTKAELLNPGFNIMTGKVNRSAPKPLAKPQQPGQPAQSSQNEHSFPQDSTKPSARKERGPLASQSLTPMSFTSLNTPSAHALLGQSQFLKLVRKASENNGLNCSSSSSFRRKSVQQQAERGPEAAREAPARRAPEEGSAGAPLRMREQKNSARIKPSAHFSGLAEEGLAFLGEARSPREFSEPSQRPAWSVQPSLVESQVLDRLGCFEAQPLSPQTLASSLPCKPGLDARLRLNLSGLAGRDAPAGLHPGIQSERLHSAASSLEPRPLSRKKTVQGEPVYQSLLSKRSRENHQSRERISNLSGAGWAAEPQPAEDPNLYYRKQPMTGLINTIDELARKEVFVAATLSQLEEDRRSLQASQASAEHRSYSRSQSVVRSALAPNQVSFDLYAPLTARSQKSSKRSPSEKKPASAESKNISLDGDMEIRELRLSGEGSHLGWAASHREVRSSQQPLVQVLAARRLEAHVNRKKIEDSPEVYIAEQLDHSTPVFEAARQLAEFPDAPQSNGSEETLNAFAVDSATHSPPGRVFASDTEQAHINTLKEEYCDEVRITERFKSPKPSLSLNLKMVKISRGEDCCDPTSQRSHDPDSAQLEDASRGPQSDRPSCRKKTAKPPASKPKGMASLYEKISRFSNYKKNRERESLQSGRPMAVDYERRKQSLKNFLDSFEQRAGRQRRDSPSHRRGAVRDEVFGQENGEDAPLEGRLPLNDGSPGTAHFGSSGRNPARIIKNIQYEVINEQDEDCMSETTRRQGSAIEGLFSGGMSRKASPLRRAEVRSSQKSSKLAKIDTDKAGSCSPDSFRRSINQSPVAHGNLRFENSARTLVKLESTPEWSSPVFHADAGEKPTPRNTAAKKLKVLPSLIVEFGDLQDPQAGARDGQTVTPRSNRRPPIAFHHS